MEAGLGNARLQRFWDFLADRRQASETGATASQTASAVSEVTVSSPHRHREPIHHDEDATDGDASRDQAGTDPIRWSPPPKAL